jgi:hypothetical protein
MASDNPQNVTIYGRLSFPRFTHKEAVIANKKSQFVQADEGDVKPEFNLLIERGQLEKLKTHIEDVFLPFVEEQFAKDPKSKNALDPKVVKKIRVMLESEEWDDTPPILPIKKVSEKNQEAAPEAVASVKIVGSKGSDITLKASVYSEDQLLVPDPDILNYPVLKNLSETVFQMYAGAYVAATLNLFAFFSSNAVNGISAGANTAVYRGNLEGARFGGGVDVDEEDIFLDD